MISLEALLLFAILICVAVLTICMVVGVVFLVRYFSTFKNLEGQVALLGKNLHDTLTPAVQEVHDTAVSLRGLIDTTQDSVVSFTSLSMIKKVSPKLAGFKLGLDLSMKAYEAFLAGNDNGKNKKRGRMVHLFNKYLK